MPKYRMNIFNMLSVIQPYNPITLLLINNTLSLDPSVAPNTVRKVVG